jgi:HPr kinase/phosphorylase
MAVPDGALNLHATCIVLGEAGILIRGPSGSGKSTLARQILDLGAANGVFARLVCDDRVLVARRNGRLVARALPAIAGRLEIRGIGLVACAYEPAAVLRMVVECGEAPARMPEERDLRTDLLGITLPGIAVEPSLDSAAMTLWRWRDVCDTLLTVA